MGLMETEERKLKSVDRREEVGFQFWLERGEWRGMLDRERKRFPGDRSDILKGSLPKSPPLGHGKSEYLRLNEEKEKENRGEATRRGTEGLYQR